MEPLLHVAIFADLTQPLGIDVMVVVTEARWEAEGSRTAPGKDVIRRFTCAAVKAAERKDAARCQAQPAGEAA